MAQYFVYGGIAEEWSRQLPYDLKTSNTVPSLFKSSGPAQGLYDPVFRVEGGPSPSLLTTRALFNAPSPSIAAGDLVMQWRAVGADYSTSGQIIQVRVGNYWLFESGQNAARSIGLSVNGVTSEQNNFFPTAYSATQPRYLRIKWSAATFQARGWNRNEAEPATWGINLTSANVSSSVPLVTIFNMGEIIVDFGFMSLSDDPNDPAYASSIAANSPITYPGGNKTVSFIVTDSDEMPVDGATVRLYHQQTGVRLGSATSAADGSVSFSVPTADICYAIVTDANNVTDTSYNFLNKPTS